MNRPLKQATALLLTLCSLLALIVLPVSAAPFYTSSKLSSTTLKEGVIYNDFGLSAYYGLGVVNGHDYLYVPFNHKLYVFDLDTWEMVDEQGMSNGTSHGAFVDSKGIVWVYRATSNIYRYDPVAQTITPISASSIMGSIGCDKLYSPIEVDGKLYFGTYGPADSGGAHIIEYNPSTNKWRDLGKLAEGAMYCSAMTYHDGYIYATAQNNKADKEPQVVVKFNLSTGKVVETLDIYNDGNRDYYSTVPYFDDIQIAGNIMFIGGNPQSKMLAIDISGNTMKFATGLTNMPTAGIVRGISEEVNGKIYFFTYNKRSTHNDTTTWTNYNDFYSYDIATKTFTKLNTGKAQTGEIRSQQKSIVTIQNDALGLNGQYVLTASTYPETSFVLYGLDGSRHEMPPLCDAKIPNRLTSFTKGPDGTNTIYMGSYMNNTAAVYNYATGTVTLQNTVSSQLDQNFFWGGKWYVTNYGACSLSEVGADGTINTLFVLNDGANKNYFSQERMHNFTAGDNKVFTSTVPHKGELGGFIAWYDYDLKRTYVAVEEDLVLYAKDGAQTTWYNAKTNQPYTFTRDFDGLVANQMIKTLVYHDGLIYASTTVYGGSQSTPVSGETAKLIVYDPVNMEMVATCNIRDKISGLASNIEGLHGIVADPYVAGRFWGQISGTLFNFTFNKSTKTFTVKEVLSFSKENTSGGTPSPWSPWKCYFDDGYLYYYNGFGSTAGSVIMVSTADPSYYAVIRADVGVRWVLGDDDNFYYVNGTKVLKYNTASIVAQVKANGPAASAKVASNNGVNYTTVQAAISATANASDKTVKLLKSTTENITVPAGVTLDLNGNTLTATNFTCNGTLADSSDGNGMVATVLGKTINVAADDLLLYDSQKTGYRVYSNFTIAPHGSNLQTLNNNTKRLWIQLTFENEDAYRVIATGYSDINIGTALSWTPTEGTPVNTTLTFTEEHEVTWGTNMQATKNYGFYIEFTGFKDLPAGTLKLTPTVNGVSSATSIVYTTQVLKALDMEYGVASLTEWWK